ncbi:MAG: 2,3-bisphosphoglycerate-independent phosphoglycerate mutase, partial [Chitinophagaceae bacterium]
MSEKAALVILDGWGIGRHDRSDAVWNAKTPFTDMLWDTFPHASLRTDGEHVGLPEGQMGNSEVGHMNIGAGRIVWQMLVRINKAFSDGSISENTMLQ